MLNALPVVVLSGFVLAALAPWLQARSPVRAGWLLGLLPAGISLYFLSLLPLVVDGGREVVRWAWFPQLNIHLSFLLDGLSLLFALMISVIGTFVVIYAGGYLRGHDQLARFYVLILSFMASMLGLVLSDNAISLFVFWELTSITSFLLIGFDHEDEKARRCAVQGLYVTVGGGLALLAGLLLMALAGGSYELSALLSQGDLLRGHGSYTPMLWLIAVGAFTKSAQVPFHFWLPNAMAAPTPVSAYLHSATMVKAGVYLLARLHPGLGGTELWTGLLSTMGALTMLTGVWMAYRSTDIKRVLAYSTVMALGMLVMLVGIGTDIAITAAMTLLLAHSLYKGALFMVAGAVNHATGTKDLLRLGGLGRAMPWTATAAVAAGISLAGLPPLFGFIAKEMMLEAVLGAELASLLVVLATLSAMLGVAVAGMVVRPFFGANRETPHQPHEVGPALLLGPLTLASLGLVFGLAPWLADDWLIRPAATAVVLGETTGPHLSLWHGLNMPLLLSALSLAAGGILYLFWNRLRELLNGPLNADHLGPERGYDAVMRGLVQIAHWQTRVLQSGYIRFYLLILLFTTITLVGYTLASRHGLNVWPETPIEANFYELVICFVLGVGAIAACRMRSKLAAVAAMGVVGFSVALMYVLFSAPDLSITQLLVETLTVILLVLALFRLPDFSRLSSTSALARDIAVAVVFGGLMTALTLAVIDIQIQDGISAYFVDASYPQAHGRNIVNVILVDFRALDTLGEIFVLALASIGVYAMIKFRANEKGEQR